MPSPLGTHQNSDLAMPPPANSPVAIPASSATVDVRIIDTTTYGEVDTRLVFAPKITGHDTFRFPSYAFLITHARLNRHVLFDLGLHKGWADVLPSATVKWINDYMPFTVEKSVQDILDSDPGHLDIKTKDISSVIWSHHHFDHRGDITSFPDSTELVLGPGFQQAHDPKDPASGINEAELRGRPIRELDESSFTLRAGQFPAHDFFGDGSLYILNAPGHTIGHIAALARLTAGPQPTFAFLGGDCAHHPGAFRPTSQLPLPPKVQLKSPSADGLLEYSRERVLECRPNKSATEPFLKANEGVNIDQPAAEESMRGMQEFDADDNVLVCISHDQSLLAGDIPFYPEKLNNWKESQHKVPEARGRIKWGFCCDFIAPQE